MCEGWVSGMLRKFFFDAFGEVKPCQLRSWCRGRQDFSHIYLCCPGGSIRSQVSTQKLHETQVQTPQTMLWLICLKPVPLNAVVAVV